MSNELRIIFIGTPDFAVASLSSLINAGKNIVAVITAPDRKAGRGQKINESAVKKYAVSKNIPVLQPTNLKNEDFVEALRSYNVDLQIVVAFRMLPEVVWNMPNKGTFNLHASLLPNYRGAAPINWAIINGESKTGVTTFFLKHKIDTGDIIFQEEVEINTDENAGSLHDKLMNTGGDLVVKTVNAIENDSYILTEQKAIDTKEAPKIYKEDCKIDWSKSNIQIDRLIRGMSPYPTAWSTLTSNNGEKKFSIKLFNASISDEQFELKHGKIKNIEGKLIVGCGEGLIELFDIQLEGKKRMKTKDLLNGFPIAEYSFQE